MKDLIQKFNQEFQRQKALVEAGTQSPKDLVEFLIQGTQGLSRINPVEWNKLYEEKIGPYWEKVLAVNLLLNEYIQSFKINEDKGEIQITLPDGEVFIETLKDLNLLIQLEMQLTPSSEEYLLVLGYLSEPSRYTLTQLYLAGRNLI